MKTSLSIIMFIFLSSTFFYLSYYGFTYLYEKYFITDKLTIDWGVFLYYLFWYIFPITSLISGFLFFYNKKYSPTSYFPLIILIGFVLYSGILYRPLRTLLLIFCVLIAFVIPKLISNKVSKSITRKLEIKQV